MLCPQGQHRKSGKSLLSPQMTPEPGVAVHPLLCGTRGRRYQPTVFDLTPSTVAQT